jgi:hypothetical protein
LQSHPLAMGLYYACFNWMYIWYYCVIIFHWYFFSVKLHIIDVHKAQTCGNIFIVLFLRMHTLLFVFRCHNWLKGVCICFLYLWIAICFTVYYISDYLRACK